MAPPIAKRGPFPASPTPPRQQRSRHFKTKRHAQFTECRATFLARLLDQCSSDILVAVIYPSNPSVTINAHWIRGISMSDFALRQTMDGTSGGPIQPASRPNLDKGFNPLTMIIFFGILAAGLLFVAYSIYADVDATGTKVTTILPYLLLMVALLIALGFEFVNGFHDTANAVATVIYTHSLPAEFAVMWSGFFNFLGVLVSSGAVAFGIVSLLPVELILQVGSSAGFAMVFALLIAAIIWNLGTWYFGLPASSSHTLIGSIIGVGVANQLMSVKTGTSGVDWGQAKNIGKSLLLSPIVGFICAALLLMACKALIPNKALYEAP